MTVPHNIVVHADGCPYLVRLTRALLAVGGASLSSYARLRRNAADNVRRWCRFSNQVSPARCRAVICCHVRGLSCFSGFSKKSHAGSSGGGICLA